MLLIGLTGGIASGKSAVSGILRSLGARVIDADRIARELVRPGLPAWREIVGRFGEEILAEDGSINRKLLGSIIFKDPAKREILNSILHPRIFEAAREQTEKISAEEPDAVVIYDAALLIETGAHEQMDAVVLVNAREEAQIRRLMERDGLTETEALERIGAQMPAEEKKKFADYIIDASGSPEEVERQTIALFHELRSRATKGGSGLAL